MRSSHIILCHPLFLLPPIPPSIRVFSSESALPIRWPKYWSINFSISPSSEYSGLISFRIDWSDLLAVQGTPKGLYSTLQQMQGSSLKSSLLVFVFDLVCLCDFLGLNQCSNPWLFLTPSAISFFLLLPTLVSITYELIEVLFIQTVKNIHYIHFNRKNLSSNTFLASGRSVSSTLKDSRNMNL